MAKMQRIEESARALKQRHEDYLDSCDEIDERLSALERPIPPGFTLMQRIGRC